MSLTKTDLDHIRGIVKDTVKDEVSRGISSSEQRLHDQIVTLGNRLDDRIDETHVRVDALRIELSREIESLAHRIAHLTPAQH